MGRRPHQRDRKGFTSHSLPGRAKAQCVNSILEKDPAAEGCKGMLCGPSGAAAPLSPERNNSKQQEL